VSEKPDVREGQTPQECSDESELAEEKGGIEEGISLVEQRNTSYRLIGFFAKSRPRDFAL
jgi:hypothetical protein